jgi:hypothetical protein
MHALPVAGHEHHAALLPHVEALGALAAELNAPGPDFSARLRSEREFLAAQLMPHMAQTEATLYPELERLMQNRHSMTPMRREHEELRRLAAEVDSLGEQPLDLGVGIRLRRVLYRMHAILLTHLAEEEAYLRVLDHNLSEADQAALVRAMEHAVAMT